MPSQATLVTAKQGDTLDLLCWQHYGNTAGTVEQALEANPGLAQLGPILPLGTQVTLPPNLPSTPTTPTVTLWD